MSKFRLISFVQRFIGSASGAKSGYVLVSVVIIAASALGQDPIAISKSSQSDIRLDNGVKIIASSASDGSEFHGEVSLGKVMAGSEVNASFVLANDSSFPIAFNRVRTTCSCVEAKIPACRLERGEAMGSDSRISVKVPQIRAKNAKVAEVILFSQEVPDREVRLTVRANIERPFFLSQLKTSVLLDQSETFSHSIPMELPDYTSVNDIVLHSSIEGLEVSIDRIPGTDASGKLTISGERKLVISEKSAFVRLVLVKDSWNLADVVEIDFYDGTLLKVVPPAPVVRSGRVTFNIVRKAGFESGDVVVMLGGNKLESVVKTLTKSVLNVTVTIPGDQGSPLLVSVDGMEIEFPVVFSRLK